MLADPEVVKKFTVTPSPIAESMGKVSGDTASALLLYRITWWSKHARITRDGKKWIVLTRDEWMIDTGMTRHQYDRALAVLKRLNLVEVRHWRLRRSDKHTRSFIRLTEAANEHQVKVSAEPESTPTSVSAATESIPPQASAKPEAIELSSTLNMENDEQELFAEKPVTPCLKVEAEETEEGKAVWNSALVGKYHRAPVAWKSWQTDQLRKLLSYLKEHVHMPTMDALRTLLDDWAEYDHGESFAHFCTNHGPFQPKPIPDIGSAWNAANTIADWLNSRSPLFGHNGHINDTTMSAEQIEADALGVDEATLAFLKENGYA